MLTRRLLYFFLIAQCQGVEESHLQISTIVSVLRLQKGVSQGTGENQARSSIWLNP